MRVRRVAVVKIAACLIVFAAISVSRFPRSLYDVWVKMSVDSGRQTYVGSPGQHLFFKGKQRNWTVDPDVVRMLCKETNYTKCNPKPRNSDAERAADRAAQPPIKLSDYVRFNVNPNNPTFEGCNYDNCQYVGQKVSADTDAVFIYGVGLSDEKHKLPQIRFPHQIFIYATWEPPTYFASDVLKNSKSLWSNAFNATMSYRLDSDIFHPYGYLDFQPTPEHELPDYISITKKKTRTAVWLVSNCGSTPSNRTEYVQEMQKIIDIDIYGRCGMPCELKDERCTPDLFDKYKFYLSFENSFSKDYVSEKFFKLYVKDSHIIPVTRGAVDYTREFPQKSLVDAAHFKGPQELAEFLKKLAEDDQEYSDYLKVKDIYRAFAPGNRWCGVCEYLHKRRERNEAPRPAIDFSKFFNV